MKASGEYLDEFLEGRRLLDEIRKQILESFMLPASLLKPNEKFTHQEVKK